MKTLWVFILLSAIAADGADVRVSRNPGTPETVTLENGLLKITFAPSLQGSLCGWEYLPQKRSIIRPLQYRVEKVDLLPDRIIVSQDGFRCRIWGKKDALGDAMQVTQLEASPDGSCSITMSSSMEDGPELSMVSRMRLLPGSTALTGSVDIANTRKDDGTYSLWFNCVFFMSGKPEPVLVPVRSGIRQIGTLGLSAAAQDGILTELQEGSRNMFFAALHPWLAKAAPDRPGVIVLKVDDPAAGQMVLYTHKSNRMHTMEIIASPERLSGGKSGSRKFQLLYFPSLTALRQVCGFYGIDVKDGALEIESSVPSGKSVWTVGGRRFQVPPLKPGRLYRIRPVCSPRETLKIGIDGKDYQIPGQLSRDLKTVQ